VIRQQHSDARRVALLRHWDGLPEDLQALVGYLAETLLQLNSTREKEMTREEQQNEWSARAEEIVVEAARQNGVTVPPLLADALAQAVLKFSDIAFSC